MFWPIIWLQCLFTSDLSILITSYYYIQHYIQAKVISQKLEIESAKCLKF